MPTREEQVYHSAAASTSDSKSKNDSINQQDELVLKQPVAAGLEELDDSIRKRLPTCESLVIHGSFVKSLDDVSRAAFWNQIIIGNNHHNNLRRLELARFLYGAFPLQVSLVSHLLERLQNRLVFFRLTAVDLKEQEEPEQNDANQQQIVTELSNIRRDSFSVMLKSLSNLTCLKTLYLDDVFVRRPEHADIDPIVRAAAQIGTLEELIIVQVLNRGGDLMPETMLSLLSSKPLQSKQPSTTCCSLQKLHLTGLRLSDELVTAMTLALMEESATLKTLHIDKSQLSRTSFHAIAKMLEINRSLVTLEFFRLRRTESEAQPFCSRHGMDDDIVTHFAMGLRQNRSLWDFHVASAFMNDMTDKGFREFASMLEQDNHTLQIITGITVASRNLNNRSGRRKNDAPKDKALFQIQVLLELNRCGLRCITEPMMSKQKFVHNLLQSWPSISLHGLHYLFTERPDLVNFFLNDP